MRTLFTIVSIAALLGVAGLAHADVTGSWNLNLKPRRLVTAYGQKVKMPMPDLPTVDQIVFTADADFPGTGSFQSQYFSGDWKQANVKIKGTPTSSVVDTLMENILSQGNFQGFTFTGGRKIHEKNKLKGKELADGSIKGKFTHHSTWKITVTQPQQMVVPLKVILTVPFSGTRAPSEVPAE